MPSLEEHGGAFLADDLACVGGIVLVLDPHAGEDLGLVPVGGNELGDGEEPLFHRFDERTVMQAGADRGDHDGVHYERHIVVLEGIGHRVHDLGAE